LAVLKLPTAKIGFIDFPQFEAAFLETNYTFSYLPITIGKQNISGKKISTLAVGCLNFIGICS